MDDGPGLHLAGSDVGCCRSGQLQVQGNFSGPGKDPRPPGMIRDTPVQHRHAPVSEEGGKPLVCIACDVGDARMTGSGSAIFVEVLNEKQGLEILAEAPNECVGFIANGINQHPFKL